MKQDSQLKPETVIKECLVYFHNNKIMKKLLDGFYQKYLSLGHVGGTVVLSRLKPEDIEVLEGFFQKNYHGKKSASISAERLQKVLDVSRFSGVKLIDLLEASQSEPLLSKKMQREIEEENIQQFFLQLEREFESSVGQKWLNQVRMEKMNPYRTFIKKYRSNKENLRQVLCDVLKALQNLPVNKGEVEYLAVFAAKITGNPHAFDENGERLNFLQYALEFLFLENSSKPQEENEIQKESTCPENDVPKPFAFEKRTELLYQAGIIKDDVSNYTLVYGINATKHTGDEHKGILGYQEEKEGILLSLYTISRLAEVSCYQKKMIVVENPSVFSNLLVPVEKNYGVLCVNGQPNLASYVLMDKLAKNGVVFLYAGDFDPEGLWIAERLKRRYLDQLDFWRMNILEYHHIISNTIIEERRLKMLQLLQEESLKILAEEICIKKKAAYQERLIEKYQKDIQGGLTFPKKIRQNI